MLTSHPIMNTQALHHLSHGDLIARPGVTRLTPAGAQFADGTAAEVDVILLATGNDYKLPFLGAALLRWKKGRPQLYLNVFSGEHDSLYILGFIEFADAACKRFGEMAQLIMIDIRARETGTGKAEREQLKRDGRPDLTGGMRYIDSPRHACYVNSRTYPAYLAQLRGRFDWPDPTDLTHAPARMAPAPSRPGCREADGHDQEIT